MSQEGTTDISYVLEDAAALRTDHIGVTSRMLFRFAARRPAPHSSERMRTAFHFRARVTRAGFAGTRYWITCMKCN